MKAPVRNNKSMREEGREGETRAREKREKLILVQKSGELGMYIGRYFRSQLAVNRTWMRQRGEKA